MAKIVRHPPSEARLVAMVKRLHKALNSVGEFEDMYAGELYNCVSKLDNVSKQRFTEMLTALGGKML